MNHFPTPSPAPISNRIQLPLCPRLQLKQPLFIDEITMLEGIKNYTVVFLKCGHKVMISKTIGLVIQHLPSNCFWRINRSYCITKEAITSYQIAPNMPISLTLSNGQTTEVSRRKTAQMRKILNQQF